LPFHHYCHDPATWPVERGIEGASYLGPRDVWGPTIAEKYKVHQNAPFKKLIFPSKGLHKNVSLALLWLSTGLSATQPRVRVGRHTRHSSHPFDVPGSSRTTSAKMVCWSTRFNACWLFHRTWHRGL